MVRSRRIIFEFSTRASIFATRVRHRYTVEFDLQIEIPTKLQGFNSDKTQSNNKGANPRTRSLAAEYHANAINTQRPD